MASWGSSIKSRIKCIKAVDKGPQQGADCMAFKTFYRLTAGTSAGEKSQTSDTAGGAPAQDLQCTLKEVLP